MARMDGNDPVGGGGDWWSENAPPAPTGGSISLYDAVAQIFRTALGREGTPDQIHQWADGKTPADLASIQQNIYNTDEAKAYGSRNATPAKPPVDPGQTPPPGPGAAPPPPLGVPTSGFGAAPPPYASNPDAPVYQPLPTYVPPTWTGGDFVNPTEADLLASPGYQARLDTLMKGKSRQFASQGTILNGGTLVALDRAGQDYASNEYQTLRNNSLEAYKLRYGQFTDRAGMDLAARTANANENQNTFANRTATYNTGNARTLSDYLTNTTTKRNSELDYWNRLNDVSSAGAGLAGGSR